MPDCVRALQRAEPIVVRNPSATRPWQHVLEPLSGYLWLGAQLNRGAAAGEEWAAFNFGPDPASSQPVARLVEEVLRHWPGRTQVQSDPQAPHEAALLSLDIGRAARVLAWHPVWEFADTLGHTIDWYRRVCADPAAAPGLTRRQISDYETAARARKLKWAHE